VESSNDCLSEHDFTMTTTQPPPPTVPTISECNDDDEYCDDEIVTEIGQNSLVFLVLKKILSLSSARL
jgi:hypothetical protein